MNNINNKQSSIRARKPLPKSKALSNSLGLGKLGGANSVASAGGGAATPVFTKQVDCMQSVWCSHLCKN